MQVKEDLYTEVYKTLYGYCIHTINERGIVFCPDDRNECLQMARVKIYEITEKFRKQELGFTEYDQLLKYCRTSIANVIVDYNRKRYVVSVPVEKKDHYRICDIDRCLSDETIQDTFISSTIEDHEREHDFTAIIATLENALDQFATRQQKQIVQERVIYERSAAELAEKFDVSAGQVNRIIRDTLKDAAAVTKVNNIDLADYF